MYKEYTFSFRPDKRHLYCSKRSRGGCYAKLLIDDDGTVLGGDFEHNHPPPVFYKNKYGIHIKVK